MAPFRSRRSFSRKRKASKRFKSRPGRSRSVRRPRKWSKKRKLSLKKHLTVKSLMQPQRYVVDYMDQATVDGTTNSPAAQLMWGTAQNQTSFTGAATSSTFCNLGMFDGQVIQLVMAAAGSAAGAASATITTSKMLVNSYRTQQTFTNVTTGRIELVHYRCIARKDIGQVASSLGVPALLANQVAVAPFGATAGIKQPPLATDYGCRPFDLPLFCKYVKVLKSRTHYLRPNGVKTFTFKNKKPKVVNWLDYAVASTASPSAAAPDPDGSTSIRQLPRGSAFSLFILRGTAATNVAATAGYRAGIGNASVLIVSKVEVNYQVITPNLQTAAMYQGLQGFSAGAAYYPMPITGVYQMIDTVNTTTGARVPITTNATTLPDTDMTTL